MTTGEGADDGLAVSVGCLDPQSHVAREGGPPSVSTLQTLPHDLIVLTEEMREIFRKWRIMTCLVSKS